MSALTYDLCHEKPSKIATLCIFTTLQLFEDIVTHTYLNL